jgi:hypothetical protein
MPVVPSVFTVANVVVHTCPPWVVPWSMDTVAPAIFADASASVARVHAPAVLASQIPFWESVVWFFTSTRSPVTATIPSIVAAPVSDRLPPATVVAIRTAG